MEEKLTDSSTIFADANQDGYGTVTYLMLVNMVNDKEEVHTTFVNEKAKKSEWHPSSLVYITTFGENKKDSDWLRRLHAN